MKTTSFTNQSMCAKMRFTPIVAGSLALLLSASLSQANEPQGCDVKNGSNDKPVVCYIMGTGAEQLPFNGIKWEKDASSDFYSPMFNSSGGGQPTGNIETLTFKYNTATTTGQKQPTGIGFGTTFVISSNNDRTQKFFLDGKGKAIQMGAAGAGTLKVDFGRGNDSRREFHLTLDNPTDGTKPSTPIFKGNIEITAGKGNPKAGEEKNSKFVGVFGGKGIEGKIQVSSTEGNTNGHITQLLFRDGADLKGNFEASAGVNKVVFENGNLEGNIIASEYYSGASFARAQNLFIFKGEGNTIKGEIKATNQGPWGGGYERASNTIIFANGGNIEGKVEALGTHALGASGQTYTISNENLLLFNKDSSIKADINANIGANHILSTEGKLTFENGSNTPNKKHTIQVEGGKEATNNIMAKNLEISLDKIYATGKNSSKNTNKITAQNLTIKNTTIEVNGTANNVEGNSNEIKVTNKGDLNLTTLKATSGNNFLTFSGKGDSTLTIETMSAANGTNSITLEGTNLTFSAKNSNATRDGNNQITLKNASKLSITSDTLNLQNLALENARFYPEDLVAHASAQRNTIIDLAGSRPETSKHDGNFRLLSIGAPNGAKPNTNTRAKGLQGANGVFSLFVDTKATNNKLGGVEASKGDQPTNTYGYAYSDRVVVHKVDGATAENPLRQNIQLLTTKDADYSTIAYHGGGTEVKGNIAVFSVINSEKGEAGKALVDLQTTRSIIGFDAVNAELTSTHTDKDGKADNMPNSQPREKDYTTYFIKSMNSEGASLANQKAAAVALGTNYELYLANLNSLNKRMGELRENTGAHGAWARIFNGLQTTRFSLETSSLYTTFQGGYDYALGFKGGNNYVGFALSYANSLGYSEAIQDHDSVFKGLRNTSSNAVEFAIYNAYVQDGASAESGWKNGFYSDSILKFSYIMSKLNFLNQVENTYSSNNFGLTLSQEIGYRFLLGADKEFYIDPQAEITLGFLNQSELKQKLGAHFMDSLQDSIFTLRNRIGSNFGYKFDKFTENRGFKASAYVGTYFVGDLIGGGDIAIITDSKKLVGFKALGSTARFALNVGTNFQIKDNTRIYFDFEKSFGGSIITDYQINLGLRYSFGTSAYTPYSQTATESTKLEDTKEDATLKEIEPTSGYYIKLLEKEEGKLSTKEGKTLQTLAQELKVQTKTEGRKTIKVYLVGPFKTEAQASEKKEELEGTLKELKAKASIIEVDENKPAQEQSEASKEEKEGSATESTDTPTAATDENASSQEDKEDSEDEAKDEDKED